MRKIGRFSAEFYDKNTVYGYLLEWSKKEVLEISKEEIPPQIIESIENKKERMFFVEFTSEAENQKQLKLRKWELMEIDYAVTGDISPFWSL